MLVLAKAVLALMIGFIMTVSFGLVAIPMLKKLKVRQRVSIFLSDKHSKKEGTPTMGGIIFIIPTLITSLILLFMDKIEFSDNLLIVMFVFVSYAALGFIDDYLIIKRKSNNGLTEMQKLFGQLFIAVVFFFIFTRSGLDPVLEIHTLGIRLDMGWFYGVFILFVLIGSSNAVNLTDGLDGLAGGLSAIAFLAFGMISWGAFWTQGNTDIAIFSFILAGSLLGFLFYNTHPAKVFMGDTGSLALGGTLAAIAILTKYEVTLVIIAGVFVIETLSSIVQMISVKYFNKKILLMAPLHHHFEKLGWEERDIVKTFWVAGLILAMMGIMFAVWI
jgi:phospho-N-acetylmuramoyl-pentapeptide-transferase